MGDRSALACIWYIGAPLKVDSILTMDHLHGRKTNIVNGYPLSHDYKDSVSHLLLNCHMTKADL